MLAPPSQRGGRPGLPRGTGVPRYLPAGDRAPPRGVDVKPTPETVPGPCPEGSSPYPGSPGVSREVSQPPQGAKKPQNPRFWGSGPSCSFPAPRAGVVLHQPLAAGPCPRFSRKPPETPKIPKKGQKGPFAGISRENPHFSHFRLILGIFGHFAHFRDIWEKRGQGPAARG